MISDHGFKEPWVTSVDANLSTFNKRRQQTNRAMFHLLTSLWMYDMSDDPLAGDVPTLIPLLVPGALSWKVGKNELSCLPFRWVVAHDRLFNGLFGQSHERRSAARPEHPRMIPP